MTPEEYDAVMDAFTRYEALTRGEETQERKLNAGEGCALGVIVALLMWAVLIGVIYWVVQQ